MTEGHPFALNMSEVFIQACDELLKPYPAHTLPDWAHFNRATGGFRTREFSILCGSTGSGKTTWLANTSAQLLKAKVKHFVMSVETGHTDFMKRLLSVMSGLDLNAADRISPETMERITKNHGQHIFSELIQFSIYDNRVSIKQLLEDLEYMNRVHGCQIAMIDNLNFFLEVTTAANSVIEVDRVIHELIMFCKRIDMHIIMVMHPRKSSGDKSTRVESEYDIKGSSTAVQEAHNVFLFNRPDPTSTTDMSKRELKIAKMRRRGNYVGRTIVYSNHNTRYSEEKLL